MRRSFFVLTLSFAAIGLHAQDIKFGLKGGYNRVSVHRVAQVNILRSLEPLAPRNSYHVGVTSSIRLGDALGLQFEPTFVRKGTLRGEDQKEWLSYLEVPVLLSVNPWKQLNIEAGPAAGFLIDASVAQGSEVSPKVVTNQREISFIIGASWDVMKHVNVGARYARSLTTVSEMQFTNESGFITDEFEEYNQYVECFVRLYLLAR